MNRRDFIRFSAATTAAAYQHPLAVAETSTAASVLLTVRPDRLGNKIGNDFTGLSYESAQLGNPNFFCGENAELAGFMRRLGASGVLRIGGNTSEYCYWTPNPAKQANMPNVESMRTGDKANPIAFGLTAGPDTGQKAPAPVSITPLAIRNLTGVPGCLRLEADLWFEHGNRHRRGRRRRSGLRNGRGRFETDCIPTVQRAGPFLS